MNEDQKNRITRFLNDKALSSVVFDVLLKTFLKTSKDRDVHNLAASMIAVEKLEEAWKELERIKNEKKEERQTVGIQRGL